MAQIEVIEAWEGRSEEDMGSGLTGRMQKAVVPYIVHGAKTSAEVFGAVRKNIPSSYEGLVRKSIRLDEIIDPHAAIFSARVTATYGPVENKIAGSSEFEFDIGGGSQRITQALQTVNKYPPTASDFEGAIGFDGKRVNGIDIVVPEYQFAESHYYSDSAVDDTFKANIASLAGKVNNDIFRGFAPGEILFLGAAGRQKEDADWQITYRFAVKKNQTGLTVGGLSGIDLNGWDILDVFYGLGEDTTAKQIIKKPVSAIVRRVYERVALGGLNL